MSEFTKGPWVVVTDEDDVLGTSYRVHLPAEENAREWGKLIASVNRYTESGVDDKHNARLIAASPTMYEAIEVALGILEDAKTLDDAQNAIPFLRDAKRVADGEL